MDRLSIIMEDNPIAKLIWFFIKEDYTKKGNYRLNQIICKEEDFERVNKTSNSKRVLRRQYLHIFSA